MTTAQVVETSVTVNNNSPIKDYVHLDDQTQPTFEMTPGFKPFTASHNNRYHHNTFTYKASHLWNQLPSYVKLSSEGRVNFARI